MKNPQKQRRTPNMLERERESLQEAGFKRKQVKDLEDPFCWWEKRIGKFLCYYADPDENLWDVSIHLPNGEVHALKKFNTMKAMLQSASNAKMKI